MTIDRIVLWVFDDLGFKTLRDHGGDRLDALLARGAFWPRCWVTPECRSTRAALLTGRYGTETGHLDNTSARHLTLDRWTTIPAALDAAGWWCTVAGKWQHNDEPGHLGFQDQLTWRSVDHARFLDLYPGPVEPAEGPVPGRPPRYSWPYLEGEDGLWASTADDYGPATVHAWAADYVSSGTGQFVLVNDLAIHKEWLHDEGAIGYPQGDLTSTVRDALFRLTVSLDALQMLGVADRTLVLVTSDNGTTGGGGKSDPTKQRGARTFAMAFGAGVVPHVHHELVSAVDFASTIVDAAGLPSPFTAGLSFLPQALGEPGAARRKWIASCYSPDPSVYPEGAHGYGPAIRIADGYMLDGVGDAYTLNRPYNPMREWFESGAPSGRVDYMLGIRDALDFKL